MTAVIQSLGQHIIDAMSKGINIDHLYLHIGVSFVLIVVMVMVVLIDLWDGIHTAKRCGEKIHSHKLRVTINKIGEYWRVMLLGFVTDTLGIFFPFYNLPYLSIFITLGIIGIEIKSVYEHIKKRKSALERLPDIIKRIKDCTTDEGSIELIDELTNKKR